MDRKKIEISNINVAFKTKEGLVKAVRNISMTLEKGSVFALIGETGSGKSVFGLSLLQLLPSNAAISGEAIYKEKNLLEMNNTEIRGVRGKKISLIPQNPDTSLNPIIKIKRQMEEILSDKEKKDSQEKIIDELKKYQLEDPKRVADSYSFQLSGGMKQRVLTASATIRQPDLIIADEPTKGLDVIVRQEVYKIFEKMKRETNIGFLLITHDLIFANKIADKLAVLYAGEVMEIGLSKDIFADPLHPYTKGFIEAQPYKSLKPIPGMPPSLIDIPKGCSFHPRCAKKMPRCSVDEPDLYIVDQRRVRCFLYA